MCALSRRNLPPCARLQVRDFAHLVIDYVPGEWLVESKSLKLFLGSFRNQGHFMKIARFPSRAALPFTEVKGCGLGLRYPRAYSD